MAEHSDIAWTTSTFNMHIGCTKVGPGCDNCYAEVLDSRRRWGGETHWGPGKPRKIMSDAYWKKPLKWNSDAAMGAKPWRVFCSSLADVFDNEAPEGQRERLWALIRATPNLTWQIVTKRIGNARKMLPPDWGNGYPNVWLISTIVNQAEAERDMPKLLDMPARIRGVSYEPALGPVDWMPYLATGKLHWIIIGGESRQVGGIRPTADFDIQWAMDTIGQCHVTGTAVFVKQLGARPLWTPPPFHNLPRLQDTQAGADPNEWPPILRIREFPDTINSTATEVVGDPGRLIQ